MHEMGSLGKIPIFAGIALVLLGLFLTFGWKWFPLGRLPGDIALKKENFTFFFPVVTCIVISIILTIILNLFFRR